MGWIVPSTREERREAVFSLLLAWVIAMVLVGPSRILPRWALWSLAGASGLVLVFWVRLRLFKRRGGE